MFYKSRYSPCLKHCPDWHVSGSSDSNSLILLFFYLKTKIPRAFTISALLALLSGSSGSMSQRDGLAKLNSYPPLIRGKCAINRTATKRKPEGLPYKIRYRMGRRIWVRELNGKNWVYTYYNPKSLIVKIKGDFYVFYTFLSSFIFKLKELLLGVDP